VDAAASGSTQKSRNSLLGNVFGIATSVVHGAKDVGKEVVTTTACAVGSVASTTVSAAKAISQGPTSAIIAAQDKASEIGSLLVNAPRTVLGQLNTFAVVQFDAACHQTARMSPHLLEWGQRLTFDVGGENIDPSGSLSFLRKNRAKSVGSVGDKRGQGSSSAFFPAVDPSTLAMSFYVMRGSEGVEKLVGQKCMSILKLLKQREVTSAPVESEERKPRSHLVPADELLSSRQLEVDLDTSLGKTKSCDVMYCMT
jgi:hypothetical protein